MSKYETTDYRITIAVETEAEKNAILDVLDGAELNGKLEFPFNVDVRATHASIRQPDPWAGMSLRGHRVIQPRFNLKLENYYD